MFEALFGSEMPLAARFFIAFVVVLALIGLAAWLVRRFGANRLANAARGRQPRLAVIDAASVDGRRRLILIRRDNIEHLLMIGGPTDVVVEQNIVRAAATRELGGREQPRVATSADANPRAVPLGDAGSWPLQPEPTPVSAPSARSYRTTSDEPWVPAEAPRSARPETNLLPPDLTARLGADLGVPPRQAAAPAAPPREPALPAEPAQNDHNLAEMAQRLEAALRRPGAGDAHPPATDPLAAPFAVPPPSAPMNTPMSAPVSAPREPRAARPEMKLEPRLETKAEPRAETRPAPGKTAYDSLEQEMASLLGRPSGKT